MNGKILSPFNPSAQGLRGNPVQKPSHHQYHGFCRSCCHPLSKCCCGHRECRKIDKELLVKPTETKPSTADVFRFKSVQMMTSMHAQAAEEGEKEKTPEEEPRLKAGAFSEFARVSAAISADRLPIGSGAAIIGGGCCVHLSVEYMPAQPMSNLPSIVAVAAVDSEGTILLWGKLFSEKYHVKECIMSTNPGAQLTVVVFNAIARVRWCEIVSC